MLQNKLLLTNNIYIYIMSLVKKCASYCKNLDKYNCATRQKCIRTKTTAKMRPYCRLSRKYTMKKGNNCKIFRKYSKKEASHTIGKFMNNARIKNANLREENNAKENEQKIKQQKSSRRITKFFKNTSNKRRALFLKSICSDSGVCIAFGKELNKIKDFFNGFVNFKFLTNVKQIGIPSNNGFVKLLTYENEGYIGNAVLKSSLITTSDNLYYEYLVGLFLNKQSYWLPSFVETYGIYTYRTKEDQRDVKTSNSVEKVKDSLINYGDDKSLTDDHMKFYMSCDKSSHLAILIQSFVGATTLHEELTKIKSTYHSRFTEIELIPILFQVYITLFLLKSIFTHYDLHTGNVLLYKPVANAYIKYTYHLDNGITISFNSPYIVKIIDYGRCFFNDTASSKDISNSVSIYKELCKIPACEPNCGEKKGYTFFDKTLNAENFYISSIINNQSHDLRLLDTIRDMKIKGLSKENNPSFHRMLQNVVFKDMYGTPNNLQPSMNDEINNVSDAFEKLLGLITQPSYIKRNTHYYSGGFKLLGELHIYSDKTPMRFIPSTSN